MSTAAYAQLLARLDQWFAAGRAAGGVVPCRGGCTACCHGPFDISVADVRGRGAGRIRDDHRGGGAGGTSDVPVTPSRAYLLSLAHWKNSTPMARNIHRLPGTHMMSPPSCWSSRGESPQVRGATAYHW